MRTVLFFFGLALGSSGVPLLCWLVAVYPYTQHASLRPLWIGLAFGVTVGLALVISCAVVGASLWPRD